MVKVMIGVAALGLSLSATAAAQTDQTPAAAETAVVGIVEIQTVPLYQVKHPMQAPKARQESLSEAPSKQAVWIPGYWDLLGNKNSAARAGWVWIPGRWALPPQPGLHWNAAHWGLRNDWWSWIPGHWTQHPTGGLDSLSAPV